MQSDILSPLDTKTPLGRFRATVCELLLLPAHAAEHELRRALASQGDDSVGWYERRLKAIEQHCARNS